jgi:hypothetical protein
MNNNYIKLSLITQIQEQQKYSKQLQQQPFSTLITAIQKLPTKIRKTPSSTQNNSNNIDTNNTTNNKSNSNTRMINLLGNPKYLLTNFKDGDRNDHRENNSANFRQEGNFKNYTRKIMGALFSIKN